MKPKYYTPLPAVLLSLILISQSSSAQISGNVFRDLNGDGVQQSSAPTERGEYGMEVKAYDASNTLRGVANTDANGDYSFSVGVLPSGLAIRLEFIVQPGDQPSKRMGANRSNVQYVVAGASATNIDFAVADRKMYVPNSNPYVVTNAYSNGDPNSSGAGTAGDRDNLMIFPYDLLSDGGPTRRAKNQHTGAVFGLAWQRESRVLLMSAYLKRHAGFGPGGIDAIYKSQVSNTGVPDQPTVLLNLTALGINVGSDPRTQGLPTISATPNTDTGVFSQVGKRGIGSMDLADNGRDLFLINMYENKLHRINIGNPLKSVFSPADVSGTWVIPGPGITGNQWHPMAVELHNGKVYVGGISTRETTSFQDINTDTVNLRAIVYELDLSLASPVFVEVLRVPMTHRRGFLNNDLRYENRNNWWSGWQNNGDVTVLQNGLTAPPTNNNKQGIYYPQPMLANIEFDVDGSMILGFRDRFGDQGGFANLFESGNEPGLAYRSLANAEILKAGRAGSIYVLENGGSVTNNGVTITSSGLAINNPAQTGNWVPGSGTPYGGVYGPGGGYFYYNQNFTNFNVPAPFNGSAIPFHYNKSNGGLLVFPGYDQLLYTAIDPADQIYTNGIIRNNNQGLQAGNMSGRLELIGTTFGSTDASSMGKAAALGDLELLLDAQAMEIGNLVWNDGNGNGRQDAGEAGIAGVTVLLRSAGADNIYGNGDDQTWTLLTDANGNYYFDESIVNDSRRPVEWIGVSTTNSGVLPGFEYRLEINAAQPALMGLNISGTHYANDAIDSDGTLATGTVSYVINPGGSTAATSVFTNNYNIDFGFAAHVLSQNAIEFTGFVAGSGVSLNWETLEEKGVKNYVVESSLNGKDFSHVGMVNSKGNGSFSYTLTDDISNVNGTTITYRLKIIETNGAIKYSGYIRFQLNKATQFTFGPNPFGNKLFLQLSSARQSVANVRIYNMTGQVVYKNYYSVSKGINAITIDNVSTFAKGMYVIEASIDGQTHRETLIKK